MTATGAGRRAGYIEQVQQSIAFTGADLAALAQRKARRITDLASRHVGEPAGLVALDVGCGVGLLDQYLAPQFGSVHGVDTDAEAVDAARAAVTGATFGVADGRNLPFDDSTFDVVFGVCFLHHVPEEDWPSVAAEMGRVLRPGGLAAVIEHNPVNPVTIRAVRRCPFDEDARLLHRREMRAVLEGAGLSVVTQTYLGFVPFGGPRVDVLERSLGWLPWGAQHCVAALAPHPAAQRPDDTRAGLERTGR